MNNKLSMREEFQSLVKKSNKQEGQIWIYRPYALSEIVGWFTILFFGTLLILMWWNLREMVTLIWCSIEFIGFMILGGALVLYHRNYCLLYWNHRLYERTTIGTLSCYRLDEVSRAIQRENGVIELIFHKGRSKKLKKESQDFMTAVLKNEGIKIQFR